MKDEVKKFPVSHHQRYKNRLDKYSVPCQVTDRWIQFPKKGGQYKGKEYLPVEIMTWGSNDKPRRICELVITYVDLWKALGRVEDVRNDT